MKNEIKEILDNLIRYNDEDDKMKWSPEDILTIEDVWLLLDYITNLQEENESLKEIAKLRKDTLIMNQDKVDNLLKVNNKLYETIEKAICYLANCDWNNKEFYDLYNILQGEYKDE